MSSEVFPPRTCINPEDIRLSENSQSQKDKYYTIPLYEVSKVAKFIDMGSRRVVTRSWG